MPRKKIKKDSVIKKTSKTSVKKEEKEIEETLPIIDGVKAIGIIEENSTGTHYRLENGTTTWVAK